MTSLNSWSDLYGELDAGDNPTHCYECNHELHKGDCINNNCPNQTRAYCNECGDLFDVDDVCYIPSQKIWLCPVCYQAFLNEE